MRIRGHRLVSPRDHRPPLVCFDDVPPLLGAGEIARYLASDPVVESDAPAVVALARESRGMHPADSEFAQACFEWVRDNIAHSFDAGDSRVMLAASDVLREQVGLCYSNSVLLTALLRAHGIPAPLCYQRLGSRQDGYVMHGLVAIWLDGAR